VLKHRSMMRKPSKHPKPDSSNKAKEAPETLASTTLARGAGQNMKPSVILVGADKGGVGKTTIARALLDYFASNNVIARAFDTEHPRGTLHRFHPEETTIVDILSTADQMKIIDTLETAKIKVSLIDVRAGGLALALQALKDMGFLDAVKQGEFNFLVFHILGPSIASLDEIEEIAPYVEDAHYFLVENHVNETNFFEWDPVTHRKYFEKVKTAGELTIPKLNEIAYEQVEIAGTPFSTFVADKTAEGEPAGHSFVLRGYVRTWQNKIAKEFDRVGLLDLVAPHTIQLAKARKEG
jgi:hypothetical protein